MPHCALVELWFCFHQHSRLAGERFHIEVCRFLGNPTAHRLVSLQDERQLCLLLLQLLDLLLQSLLLALPQVHLVLQCLRLVHPPLPASGCCKLVPLPPHLPPLLLLGAKRLLLHVVTRLPPSPPVHFLLLILLTTAWL